VSQEYKSVVAPQHNTYISNAATKFKAHAKEQTMSFRTEYPEYAAIESQIQRAHAERSVYLAHLIANATERAIRGLRELFGSLGRSVQAAHERQLIEADSFLKRSVPRY
jgi:hypothetical protein